MSMPSKKETRKRPHPEEGYEERELSAAEWVNLRSFSKPGMKTFFVLAALERKGGTLRQSDLLPTEREMGNIWGFQNLLNIYFRQAKLSHKVVMRHNGRERRQTEMGSEYRAIDPRIVLLTKKKEEANGA